MEDAIIGAVVDRSGSMGGAESGVIAGFNEFRNEQALQPGNAWLTLTLFDDRVETPYVAWNCRDIPMIDGRTYFVRGSTALNDAFVGQIEQMDKWLADNQWFAGKKVVLVITDGYENASKRFPMAGNRAVQELSQKKKAEGWEFVVFGANVPAENIAAQLGIDADRAHQFTADPVDSRNVYAAASFATTSSRSGDAAAYTSTTRHALGALREQEAQPKITSSTYKGKKKQ